MDIALSKMGHVYHTRHDSLDVLRPGVLQHAGELLHALLPDLANSDQFRTKVSLSSRVAFH